MELAAACRQALARLAAHSIPVTRESRTRGAGDAVDAHAGAGHE